MRRNLLLSAAVAVCVALPAASLADPPSDNSRKKDQQSQQHQQHQRQGGQGGGQGQGQQGKGASQGPSPAQDSGDAGGNGAAAHRKSAATSGGQFQAQQPQGRTGQVQSQTRQTARQLPTPPPLAGWNRTARGADRDQAGQQWRQGHQGWDSNARWRQDPDWWRRDSSFRFYFGPRIGFFFIPELGYVSAPEQYRQHYWRPGEYLPDWFWRYQVRDYERYGLPQPPDGCVWIWLDGDVALMDGSDGYIIDIVRNAW